MQRKWKRQWQRALTKVFVPVVLATTLFFSSYATGLANPSGSTVSSGSATVTNSGTTTTITQTTDKVSINWQSFDIAKGETVNFLQPGASSIALNRVVGSSASAIYGALNANGKVFLVNPNGILFAPGSQVNVGSLLASTQNLSDSDFLAGKYSFSNGGSGSVVNQGTIQAADGGYVALLGNQVSNEGVIIANKGSVALAAGNATTLDFAGDGLINLTVDQEALNAQASNNNLIQANGGLVVMTAKAAGDLTGTVVNNSGIIQAQGLAERNGKIVLDGGANGVVSVSGTLDASGKTSGLTGGTVKVLGDEVLLASTTRIDVSGDQGGGIALIGGAYQGGSSEKSATLTTVEAGAAINADAITNGDGGQVIIWANDTTKFSGTITSRGGSVSGNGGNVETSGKKNLSVSGTVLVGATNGRGGNWLLDPTYLVIDAAAAQSLSTALSAGATVTNTASNITVTSPISWSSNNSTLILNANSGAITVSSPITYSGDGSSLQLLTGTGSIYINADITASGNGNSLVMTYGNAYKLANGAAISFNAGSSTTNNLTINGDNYTLEYTLEDLVAGINTDTSGMYALGVDVTAPTASYSSSLISTFSGMFDGLGHSISGLTISASSSSNPTGLFGYLSGTIRNIGILNGTISNSGTGLLGGLVGYNAGSIINSYNGATITGYLHVGGLVGENRGDITDSYNSGDVSSTGIGTNTNYDGTNVVGGLVGAQYSGTISNSYNTGTVNSYLFTGATSNYQVDYVTGGLVGGAWGGSIISSYNNGEVNGSSTVGGLVGVSYTSITNSYNAGTVNATSNDVGGLVGTNYGAISASYNTGEVLASIVGDVYSSSASNDVGGLVGTNNIGTMNGVAYTGTITNSYSTGNVTGTGWVGGLVGYNIGSGTSITDSHSTGDVTGYYAVGGLAGQNDAGGIIGSSYSSGAVSGANRLGGFVGKNSGSITNSHSSGAVTRTGSIAVTDSVQGVAVGGLVGYNTGTISAAYSSGTITSDDTGVTNSTGGTLASFVGGLVGNNTGTISDSTSTSAVYSHVGNSSSGISTYYAEALVGKNQGTVTNSSGNGTTILYVDSPLSLTSGLTLVSSGDIAINSAITSTDSLYLDAGGKITESGSGNFSGDYLRAYSHGTITLNGANDVNYFSATSDNYDIYFHDVIPAGEQLTLGSGDPTVYINAGTGNFYLTVDGSLNSSNVASHVNIANTLIANGLYLYGPNCRFWLYGQDYLDINTLAANVGTMAISDPDGFTIGTVGNLSGITSNGIWNGSTLVNSSVGLESGGTITQTAPINVIRLLLGEGSFVLDNASNHVGSLATYSYSAYSMNGDSNTIAKTNSGTVNITYRDAGDLLIDSDITYGDTASILASGSVNLTAASIGFTGNGGLGVTAKEVTLTSSGNITVDNTITTTNGAVTAIAGKNITLNSVVASNGGNITLVADNNFINNLATDTGIQPGSGYNYYVYSTDPDDTVESMSGYNERYGQAYKGTRPNYATTGNWFFYKTFTEPMAEAVTTAVTHSNQTIVAPPPTVGLTGGAGNTNIPVEIVHTGVNLDGITSLTPVAQVPSALQITPASGQSRGYNVTVTGQTVTVSLAGADTTGQSETVSTATGNIAVVRVGEGTQPVVYYSATGSRGSLTLAPTESTGQTMPPEPTDNASATRFTVGTGGAEFQMLHTNGALSIWPTNEAAVALLQAGDDSSKLVVVAGILVAQQNLDDTIQAVEAVFLHF